MSFIRAIVFSVGAKSPRHAQLTATNMGAIVFVTLIRMQFVAESSSIPLLLWKAGMAGYPRHATGYAPEQRLAKKLQPCREFYREPPLRWEPDPPPRA